MHNARPSKTLVDMLSMSQPGRCIRGVASEVNELIREKVAPTRFDQRNTRSSAYFIHAQAFSLPGSADCSEWLKEPALVRHSSNPMRSFLSSCLTGRSLKEGSLNETREATLHKQSKPVTLN